MESVVGQFFTTFWKFKEPEATTKSLRFPDSMNVDELSLRMLSRIDMDAFEMQLIES